MIDHPRRTGYIRIAMRAKYFRFTTKDRLILQGIIYTPTHPTKRTYLHIHGMGGNFYQNRFLIA
jgi:hypothetical protein